MNPRRLTIVFFLAAFLGGASLAQAPAASETPPPASTGAALDAVFSQIEALTHAGFPGETRKTWWKSRMDPFINACSTDTGLSQNVITFLMWGETEGEGAMASINSALESYGLAFAAYDVVKNLADGRQDLAFYTTAKTAMSDLLGRLGRSGKLAAASLAIIDYSLTTLGQSAVTLTNQTWWDAYLDYQLTEGGNDDYWIGLFMQGGHEAVAAKLDEFWVKTAQVHGEAFFRTNNPNCQADYRARFMREFLLPRLRGWLEAEMRIRKEEAARRLQEMHAAMARATFRVFGQIVNAAGSSSHPLTWEVRLLGPEGRVLAREKRSDGDHFELVGEIKDIPSGDFRLQVNLVDEATDKPQPRADISGTIGVPSQSEMAPVQIERHGYDVYVHLDEIHVAASARPREVRPAGAALLEVPKPLDDNLPKHEARLQALRQQLRDGRLPVLRYYDAMEREMEGAVVSFEQGHDRLAQIRDVLQHNLTVRQAPYDKGQEAGPGSPAAEAADRLRGEWTPGIMAASKAAAAYQKTWEEFKKRWQDEINQTFRDYEKRRDEAEQQMDAAKEELQPALHSFEEARDEIRGMQDEWESLRSSVDLATRSGQPDVRADRLKALDALADGGLQRYEAAVQRATAAAERIRSGMEAVRGRAKVLADVLTEGLGVPAGGPPELFARFDEDVARFERFVEEAETERRLLDEAKVREKVQRSAEAAKKLAASKRAQMAEAAALLQQFEAALAQCPGEDAIAAVGRRYATVVQDVDDGVQAYARAVAQGAELSLPAGLRDAQGNDAAFWQARAEALKQFAGENAAVVGDLLPPPLRRDTPLSEAIRLGNLVAVRSSDFPEQDAGRRQSLLAQVAKLRKARVDAKLPLISAQWRGVNALAVRGANPAERLRELVAANEQLQHRATEARTGAAGLSRLAADAPEAAVRQAGETAAALIRPLADTTALPEDFIAVQTWEAIGQGRAAVAASGVWTALRQAEQRPAAPASIKINGREVPLDGGCVRLTRAESNNGKLTITIPPMRSLNQEYAINGSAFYPVNRQTWEIRLQFPPRPGPTVLVLQLRNGWLDGSAFSLLPDEPPVTIVLGS